MCLKSEYKINTLDGLNVSYVGCYGYGKWIDSAISGNRRDSMECLQSSTCPPGVEVNLIAMDYHSCLCLKQSPEPNEKRSDWKCSIQCPDDEQLGCGGPAALSIYQTTGFG